MRKMSFALALMAVLGFSGLMIESASAQNNNMNMNANMHSKMGGHRRHRKHRRARRHKMNKTGNANE
jgi:hypothetical protein